MTSRAGAINRFDTEMQSTQKNNLNECRLETKSPEYSTPRDLDGLDQFFKNMRILLLKASSKLFHRALNLTSEQIPGINQRLKITD